MTMTLYAGIFIIVVTILGVALGRYPFLRMNRTTIALVGAVALILAGAISIDAAYAAIDLNTIVLLFSVMVLNVNFRICGFFSLVTAKIVKFAKTPRQFLALLILSSGILSALFLNDTIVLVFTPIVVEITLLLKRNPVPYLIALATSANIGSAATIIGNPQNILIGISSGISFSEFALYLAPVACLGMVLTWLLMILIYRHEFKPVQFDEITFPKYHVFRPLLQKSLVSAFLMLIALIASAPTALAAMGAAALLLVTRRIKPERVFIEIDWSLLVFFSALFVVTRSVDTLGISSTLVSFLKFNAGSEIFNLAFVSTILSNLVSNVPAVLLLRPMIAIYTNAKVAWLILAMATTFAGNLTLLGSVANLIVAESAKKRGVILSFSEYLKVGVPVTILSILLGTLWLGLFYFK